MSLQVRTQAQQVRISRILHAGYVFESESATIAFDPIFESPFSHNCYAYPNVKFDHDAIKELTLSAVFISHYHDDHCSLESLNLLDRNTPIFIFCLFSELFEMVRDLGFSHVHPLTLDQSVQVGDFTVTALEALDSEVDSVFQVQVCGLNILNVVDSWIGPSTMAKLIQDGPWDLVLWPFQVMRELEILAPNQFQGEISKYPLELIEQLQRLAPKYLVPSSCQFIHESWSWYNQAFFANSYRQFETEIKRHVPGTRVMRLNPGVSVSFEGGEPRPARPLGWVIPVGEQEVDYHYDPAVRVPPTAEIAKNFLPLSAEQTENVYQYCRQGLVERYRSLAARELSDIEGGSEPAYFILEPKKWRLLLYDHSGSAFEFTYLVSNHELRLLVEDDPNRSLAWSTEVPMARLYAAIENGETLTSMYLRINGLIAEPGLIEELRSVDLLQDPLVRCLFTGVFGAYQRAQLRRLRSLT